MNIPHLHDWPITCSEAETLQGELAPRLILRGSARQARLVAGVDCSFEKNTGMLFATVVLWDRSAKSIRETAFWEGPVTFPYVPGFLSFREAPGVLEAFRRLSQVPDAVIFDGQGVAHPRGFGLAAHLGLWLNIPSAGCAKSRLIGHFDEPGNSIGAYSPLFHQEAHIGQVVRTRPNCRPVYVSPGHLLGFDEARELIMSSCQGYRLPEPTRLAHREANRRRLSQV